MNDNDQYLLPANRRSIQPDPSASEAIALIRQKLERLYAADTTDGQPIAEGPNQVVASSSPAGYRATGGAAEGGHQRRFLQTIAGQKYTPAQLQDAWHAYYQRLSDHQKHQVWHEHNNLLAKTGAATLQVQGAPAPVGLPTAPSNRLLAPRPATAASTTLNRGTGTPATKPLIRRKLVHQLQARLRSRLSAQASARPASRWRSLGFGIACGAVSLMVLMFSFFNERFVAPFVTPSRMVSNAPLIIDPGTAVTDSSSKIIIPKINVDIPVVYDEPSIEEPAMQKALERGAVHFATTPSPGQIGNGVIFGHSSNNILNPGQYKFAFVLLHRLQPGDTFMLQKDGKRYVYKVYKRQIVKPSDVGVLGPADKPSTFTLITCDPPGTSLNRLVVTGEQISPDPAQNSPSQIDQSSAARPRTLPSNSPGLWQRLTEQLGR